MKRRGDGDKEEGRRRRERKEGVRRMNIQARVASCDV